MKAQLQTMLLMIRKQFVGFESDSVWFQHTKSLETEMKNNCNSTANISNSCSQLLFEPQYLSFALF